MFSAPSVGNRSLSFSGIIAQILKYPIAELIFKESKELGDEAIASLEFVWLDNKWIKDPLAKNKFTMISSFDCSMFNDVFPLDQLLDLSVL